MRFVLFFLFLVSSLLSQDFNIGEKINKFTLPDQFNKIHSVNGNIKTIVVSFEKNTGKMVNEFLASKPADFLQKHQAVFIANISGMPSIITKLFALPKMQDYKHPILLIYDENDKRFLQKDEVSSVYKIENSVIKDIKFVNNKKALEEIF